MFRIFKDAVAGLGIPAFLLCLGFGVDAFHGVCHAHFLENTAALSQDGAFLGTTSLLPQMDEARRYLELVDWSVQCNPGRPSIVNTSIATAVQGYYGDVHATFRTEGSRLWINPLMSIYWTYELAPVVDRITYREALEATESFEDLVAVLQPIIRRRGGKRPKQPIPV